MRKTVNASKFGLLAGIALLFASTPLFAQDGDEAIELYSFTSGETHTIEEPMKLTRDEALHFVPPFEQARDVYMHKVDEKGVAPFRAMNQVTLDVMEIFYEQGEG